MTKIFTSRQLLKFSSSVMGIGFFFPLVLAQNTMVNIYVVFLDFYAKEIYARVMGTVFLNICCSTLLKNDFSFVYKLLCRKVDIQICRVFIYIHICG